MLRSTNTATSNPEVNLQGNAVSIPSGNTAISAGNNTDFGTSNTGTATTKVFNIQNTGTGPLWISSMEVSGPNAGDFVILNQPTYPLSIAAGSSQTFAVQFTPSLVGTRSATISVNNNDYTENLYDFSVQGVGTSVSTVGIQSIERTATFVNVFPNPAKDEAIVSVTLDKAKHVSVSIFDVTGKQVSEVIEKDLHEGNNQLSVNTNDLKNGVYFVQVTAGANTNQIKLIVKH
jgi:hypothetical protein